MMQANNKIFDSLLCITTIHTGGGDTAGAGSGSFNHSMYLKYI
jgi:hypothetical protein